MVVRSILRPQERIKMKIRTQLPFWALLIGALTLTAFVACGDSTASDADGSPAASGPAPDVVVVIEQQNNPNFDLKAREINGVDVSGDFDDDSSNNMEEPLVIPPGQIRFFLDNVGTLAHAFQVRNLDGENIAKTRNVGPRKTGELVVELAAGEYEILCQLSDHAKRGSRRTLIVDAAADYPKPPR
ncbi:MAG TPA: hypothetical protein DCP37_17725 [Dehalococcoidia bacterium]|nr:hypothetical protein [Dehalococcoidia bacterium]